MALDVFHQVLARLYEVAGGNPKQMVSIVDVLKQEKLFGSVDMILDKLHAEGWIADASKKDHVFVTTWGVDEVRKVAAPPQPAVKPAVRPPEAPASKPEPKGAAPFREAAEKARDLAALLDELAAGGGGTGAQRKAKVKKALGSVSSAVEEAFG